MSLTNPKTRKTLNDVKTAFDELEKGRFQEAYELALAVQASAAAEGITSTIGNKSKAWTQEASTARPPSPG